MGKTYKYRKDISFEGRRYSVRANDPVELGRKIEAKMRELESDSRVVSGDTLLRDWAQRCIETYKTEQAEITRKKYINRVNHCILEHIGDMPLKKIRPLHCQETLNIQQGNSRRQINEVYQAMRFLFRYALANHLVSSDPTEYLVKPKGRPVQSRRALTPYERKIVVEVANGDRRYYYYLLMLFCGCRPSEAANCRGADIKIVEGHNMLHIRGRKSANADRFVPIPAELYAIIKDTPKLEYIAQTEAGNKITNTQRLWSSFKRNLNIAMGCRVYRNQLIPPYPLAPDLVPYCFRHEYCTELARRGVDIRIAQKLMGHSTIDLTANIYTNLQENDIAKIAAALSGNEVDAATGAATSG